MTGPWVRIAWLVLAFGACGALTGVAWHALWEPPTGVAFKGEWFLDPVGPDVALSGTALYVLVALAVGLVLGAGVAQLPRHETATLVGVVLGSVLAAWVMYSVGHALGPPDPRVLAAGEPDFTTIPAELVVAAPGDSRNPLRSPALLAMPVGSLSGLCVVYLLGRRRAG